MLFFPRMIQTPISCLRLIKLIIMNLFSMTMGYSIALQIKFCSIVILLQSTISLKWNINDIFIIIVMKIMNSIPKMCMLRIVLDLYF